MTETHGERQRTRRSFMSLLGMAGLVGGTGDILAADPGREPGPKPNEILVGGSEGASREAIEEAIAAKLPPDAKIVHVIEEIDCFVVEPPERATETTRASMKDGLGNAPNVEYIEDNVTYSLFPNDPHYTDGSQYAPDQINAPEAWETTLGDPEVLVAVIDTGIDYDHEDIAPNVTDAVPNHGWDFVDEDSDPFPDDPATEFHATHVAGIACGATDNGEGIAGISDCSVLSCRALTPEGGSVADLADAIVYATDRGADVLNMSLGAPESSQALKDALNRAVEHDVLPIAASGNAGREYGEEYQGSEYHLYPAENPDVMTVSAVDNSQNFAYYSSYGDAVDVCAPGSDVLSTIPQETADKYFSEDAPPYANLSGTSMAAPVVAGVAGLVCSLSDDPVDEVRSRIKGTATDLGLPPEKQGHGQVDAAAAVRATVPSLALSGTSVTVTPGETVRLSIALENRGPNEIAGPAVSIGGLPADWTIENYRPDGGTFKRETATWVWLTIGANAERSPTATLGVPEETPIGTYEMTAKAIMNGTVVKTAPVTVAVTGEAASLAQQYDNMGDDDDHLDLTELQTAIEDWANDTDHDPTLSELQQLIAKWKNGVRLESATHR